MIHSDENLIIVSDFHLGEGARRYDGSQNSLEEFLTDQKFEDFLAHQAEGHQKAVLILAGNFFDMMTNLVIPDFPDMMFEAYAVEKMQACLEGHPRVVRALQSWLHDPHKRLVYLTGYCDAGVKWPKVQALLKKTISPRIEFVGKVLECAGLHIEHGSEYDPLFASEDRRDFENKGPLQLLKMPWAAFFYSNFVLPLRQIRPQFFRVRPLRTYLVWALVFETRFFFKVSFRFIRMLLAAFSNKFYPGNSFRGIFSLFRQVADSERLEEAAEKLLDDESLRAVIFGHSRIASFRQFEGDKFYFNLGSWTRNLSLDMRALGAMQKLTYVLVPAFEREPSPSLMEWRGHYEPVEDFIQ